MGLLPAALLAELQRPNPSSFPLAEFGFPDGTKRYASGPVNVIGTGPYAGKVPEGGWPTLTRAISDRDNNLALQSADIRLIDTDQSIAAVLEGPAANAVRGSSVTLKLASMNVPSASWFTVFSGFVDSFRMDDPFVWTFGLHAKDLPLRGKVPRRTFDLADWPNMLPANKGLFVPLIYGIHDSRGLGNAGMVPCYLVDSLNNEYTVAGGWLKAVDRVYKDGALQSSGYTVNHAVKNGNQYTTVKFSSSQGGSIITADVQGYESAGDGTGALLTGANALKHLLVQYAFNDYRSGAFVADETAPISVADFATLQSYLTAMSMDSVSVYYGGQNQATVADALNDFCRTLQVYAFFKWSGDLSILPDDPRGTTIYLDDPSWLREDRDIGSIKLNYDASSLVDRISVQHLNGTVPGRYLGALEARDANLSENVTGSLAMPWSKAAL